MARQVMPPAARRQAVGGPAQGIFDPSTAPPGVLAAQHLRDAVEQRWISSPGFSQAQLQPASIDLTLGDVAYRLLCSFLPDRDSTVAHKVDDYVLEEFSIAQGAILERNRAYLIPLRETLSLPEAMRAKANPKSSTGRLDIFTRLITDNNARFDDVPFGYSGQLYLEVVPRSFIVKVSTGLSLNQLRLFVGEAGTARLSDADVLKRHSRRNPLVVVDDKPVAGTDLDLAEGLFLSVDLNPNEDEHSAYKAKQNSRVIDLAETACYEWSDYWEPVTPEASGKLILEPEAFYLLLSREGVIVPPDLAAEMSAYDPTAGELRTHYAGFFDPGFGYKGRAWPNGSRATLEVRARDVAFMIEHGQRLCKLVFEQLTEPTVLLYGESGSTYQNQRLTLSKHFKSQGPIGQLTLPETLPIREQI